MQRLLGFFGALLLWVNSIASFAQSPAALLPIDQFTRYDSVSELKLSPNGEYVAFLTGKYGTQGIAAINLKDKKTVAITRAPDGFAIFDFDWVSNTRLIFRIAEKIPGMAQPAATGEIFAADFNGKNQTIIYGYRAGEVQTGTRISVRQSSYAQARLVSPLLKDDQNILIAEYPLKQQADGWHSDPDAKPSAVILNVYDGSKRILGQAPLVGATLLVDRDDRVRFAIGMNQQHKLAVSWKPEPSSGWTDFFLPGFRDESVFPQLFSDDDQTVFFIGSGERDVHSALYSVNLTSHEVVKIFGFEDAEIDGLIYDFSHKYIVGVTSNIDKPIYHWINANDRAAKLRSALDRAFPNQTVNVTSTTTDGSLALVFVSSDINPGDYYLFNTQNMKADYLYPAMEWIDPKAMRPTQSFTMKARDGLELHGYVTRPLGDGPYPLVVLPHGVRDTWSFDRETQLFANHGYAVLQVNYRGSVGFGDDFETKGYREWGARIQDDITDATRWAIEQKIAAADRICIYGASFGGYAALQGAVREPALYKCAIGYAGIYDLEFMYSSGDIRLSKRGQNYLQEVLGNDHAALQTRSPAYHADKIQIPILIIHGKEDWRAAFEQAERMKKALEKNKKAFEWMAISREGHGVYDEETRREVYERILKFLDKNLMTGTTSN